VTFLSILFLIIVFTREHNIHEIIVSIFEMGTKKTAIHNLVCWSLGKTSLHQRLQLRRRRFSVFISTVAFCLFFCCIVLMISLVSPRNSLGPPPQRLQVRGATRSRVTTVTIPCLRPLYHRGGVRPRCLLPDEP
jgi:hypothetical protein